MLLVVGVLIAMGHLMVLGRGPHHPRGEARHVHYKPDKNQPQKITENLQLLHDKEHLQDHLEDVISEPDLSKLTDEELEFYYFQVHDTDKNSKLDGLEILQAILHTTHQDSADNNNKEDFDYYIELIDNVLAEDDLNNDGYLSYTEYVSGRQKSRPSVKMLH